ncbi:hypothetical protein [Absidia glauca]|uniref:Uncharacterized protein n=1 Tax=Absidia glauca TaxID=4829 RepID=A0A168SPN0_ABSGL|nr:hypothetical protein [Absidia glauca]
MLGRIEPMSEYNTHTKAQGPKFIQSVSSPGPPDPTTVPLTSYSNSDRPIHRFIQTSIQHISPGNATRPLILPLKQPDGAQFETAPGNGSEYGARKFDMVMH